MKSEQEILKQLAEWAEARKDVRAAILTSSRANPNAAPDVFSDYDVILAVRDINPYKDDDAWLTGFGPVLTVYHDPVRLEYGFGRIIRVTQYEDSLKIDFTVWPVDLLGAVVRLPELPPYLDVGYKVLLDKDDLTSRMKTPTCTAFIPKPPTEKEYLIRVEHYLSNTSYLAKHLRRGHLMPLKSCFDIITIESIREMFEWKVGLTHNWSVRVSSLGGGLENYIRPELWEEFARTYTGAGDEENWQAVFRSIALFRKVAIEVAEGLGFTYPQKLEDRVLKYLNKVKCGELP